MAVILSKIKRFVFAPGGIRIITMRWGLLVLSSLPGIWMAGLKLDPFGRQLWFTEAGDPSPFVQSLKLLEAAGGPKMVAVVFLCMAIALVGHQMLASGAIRILHPKSEGKPRVLKTVAQSGLETLWPYIRIVFWAAVWLGAGVTVVNRIFEFLLDGGKKAGWTMLTMQVTLPMVKAALLLFWANLVGAFAHWCRVLTRVDNRKYVCRTVLLVFKSWRGIPFQGPVLYVCVSIFSSVAGGLTLFAWRQSTVPEVWAAIWGASLFFQCFLWFCLTRAACISAERETIRRIRREPDEPWRVRERFQTIVMKYRIGDRLYSRVRFFNRTTGGKSV